MSSKTTGLENLGFHRGVVTSEPGTLYRPGSRPQYVHLPTSTIEPTPRPNPPQPAVYCLDEASAAVERLGGPDDLADWPVTRLATDPGNISSSSVIMTGTSGDSFDSTNTFLRLCPPSLVQLQRLDQFLIKQTEEIYEECTGFSIKRRFKVSNSTGDQLFMALSNNQGLGTCGGTGSIKMVICDLQGTEVINLFRPSYCLSNLLPLQNRKLEVQASSGSVIGFVQQNWILCHPSFAIKDERGETIFTIEGDNNWSGCFSGSGDFAIISPMGIQVGLISKQWRGLNNDLFIEADSCGITFPLDTPVKMKATLLGAVFLIHQLYF